MRHVLMIAVVAVLAAGAACSQGSPFAPQVDRSRTVQTAEECGGPDMDPC